MLLHRAGYAIVSLKRSVAKSYSSQAQGYRIWIFSLAVLPMYRIPEAIMRLHS